MTTNFRVFQGLLHRGTTVLSFVFPFSNGKPGLLYFICNYKHSYDETILFSPNRKLTYARKVFPETRKRMLEKFNGNTVKPAKTTFYCEIR